jgi:hypothetical protein
VRNKFLGTGEPGFHPFLSSGKKQYIFLLLIPETVLVEKKL